MLTLEGSNGHLVGVFSLVFVGFFCLFVLGFVFKIQWLVHPDVAIDLSTLRTGVSGIVAVLILGF